MHSRTIVTLCGSLRFPDAWVEATQRETLAGKIVLSVGCPGPSGCPGHSDEEKAQLDELHLDKIAMSDEILVLNLGGYIGESTRREVAYAHRLGKRVRWLEEPA